MEEQIANNLKQNIPMESHTMANPVVSTLSFLRAHTAQILTVGSGGVNAGTIAVRQSTTTTNVFLSMVIGRNQTNNSAYTVPSGFTGLMRRFHVALSGKAIANTPAAMEGNIWTRNFGQPFRSRRPFTVSTSFRLYDDIYGGLVFPEKSDIVIRINDTSASDLSVNGGYDLILIQN